jgi:hypothetical protein
MRSMLTISVVQGDDEQLMQTIHLANIACGFHAGSVVLALPFNNTADEYPETLRPWTRQCSSLSNMVFASVRIPHCQTDKASGGGR